VKLAHETLGPSIPEKGKSIEFSTITTITRAAGAVIALHRQHR
jgi:hypothetical protein